jgi:hypothetical protein
VTRQITCPSLVRTQIIIKVGHIHNVAAISEFLKPYDTRLMRCYPVSTRINHVVNDDEECSRPIELTETQSRLFVS